MPRAYNNNWKLVRDKIPLKVAQSGREVNFTVVEGDDLMLHLGNKLIEEANEVHATRLAQGSTPDVVQQQRIEELADLLEVVYKYLEVWNLTIEQVQEERARKRKDSGSFEAQILMDFSS